MIKDSKLLKNGKLPLTVLSLFLLSSCRTVRPPKIEVCILNGAGLGDCVEVDGTRVQKTPSEMENYWSTNEVDMQKFASFCYGAKTPGAQNAVKSVMSSMKSQAK